MDDSNQLIDRICDAFEAAWQSGGPPQITDYVTLVDTSLLDRLLIHLIPVDVECRIKDGVAVSAADYQSFGNTAVAAAEQCLRQQMAEPASGSPSENGLDAADGQVGNDATVLNPPGATPMTALNVPGTLPGQPHTIGPYKLLQQIGQGGMGLVFMADQAKPVRRRVALKLIKAGMDSRNVISRFEAERQALAMMDHQNIAKVLDAGTTDQGQPYFVMELVNGIPITEYCDNFKLSIDDRLGLFTQVCRAIQHAHQKGIIHRDIKPSNVLVTQHDGTPLVKVIDFGLAKALQATTRLSDNTLFTEFGQVVGTLQYMSPEQAEVNALDVDTRSDVYSLGVLLYELLTGSTPIERQRVKELALDMLLAVIRSEEAPRPSRRLSSIGDSVSGISEQRKTDPRRLGVILRGDLDWIAMKALEKDRTRRYDSPVQMAEDVERYLKSEAIIARPPSVAYRLKKVIRKHRSGVIVGATMLLLLIAFLIGTSAMWFRAERLAESNKNLAIDNDRKATNERNARIDADRERKNAKMRPTSPEPPKKERSRKASERELQKQWHSPTQRERSSIWRMHCFAKNALKTLRPRLNGFLVHSVILSTTCSVNRSLEADTNFSKEKSTLVISLFIFIQSTAQRRIRWLQRAKTMGKFGYSILRAETLSERCKGILRPYSVFVSIAPVRNSFQHHETSG